jgi:putative transposase
MTLKAYKYRIYPTLNQTEFFNQNFGAVRFLWNKLVENFNAYSTNSYNDYLSEKILKDNPDYPWLKDVISYALQQKHNDFKETKKQFFNKKRKIQLGRMKFKKKGISKDSFRIPGLQLAKNFIDFDNNTIKIPKMEPMKVVIDRKFNGQVRNVTISKNKCNQFFISVLVDEEIAVKDPTGRYVGIDLGLKDLFILSDGQAINNPRWFRENQTKLKKAQRHLSRKTKGSNRYNKQRLKVAKVHLKTTNQRNYFLHNISTAIVTNYDIISIEDLDVSGMLKNHKLAKSIADASWSTFTSMLDYKCRWYGKSLVKIDRFYPSSKTCSSCGYKLDKLPLSIREWTCPECGIEHDRDLNAAVNILNKGFKDLTSAELVDYGRGEVVRLFDAGHQLAASVKRLVIL